MLKRKTKNIMKYDRKCEECYGEGSIESMIQTCTVYRGDCCGGCTTTIDCPECDGQGEIEIDTDEELEDELGDIYNAIEDIYIKLRSDKFSESEISSFIDKEIIKIKSEIKNK